MATIGEKQRERWTTLTNLVGDIEKHGLESLPTATVKEFCRLYRHVTIDLSQARTAQADTELVQYLNRLAARAHSQLYTTTGLRWGSFIQFILTGFPRAFRRQWRVVSVAVGVLLLTSLASFAAVLADPELAYSIFDEHMVEFENVRLEKTKGEFRGNFTFSVEQSPLVAVAIIGNNVRVSILIFALGALCCLPGLLLLAFNGRMLGTLSGLVWNHGFFIDFYSLISTHGVLELSAICISCAAGLLLGWAIIAPGELSRRAALRRAALEAFALLGGAIVMLCIAGVIEAYATPHFPAFARWMVAGLSAIVMFFYLGFAGRRKVISNG